MNKTLLLILCDFLLLTLLALTRWESAEPPRPTRPAPAVAMSQGAATPQQDLVDTMRQSLADEQAVRAEMEKKLSDADSTLQQREQRLAQLQADRNTVAATLSETQRAAAELSQKYNAASQEATMTKEQLAQLQRELQERQALADRLERERQALAQQQAESQKRIQGLTTAVAVAEQEKRTLRETADTLKSQVETERNERLKVQETATQLAQGVGQLAEKSGELTKEIRDNRPINANVIFNEYLTNRVRATFTANRRVLFGSPTRTKDANTVLVTDGRQVYALLHLGDTLFSLGDNPIDWESLKIDLTRNDRRVDSGEVRFLAQDPRIVALPIDAREAAALGARVYPLTADPFKFPEAVLIDGSGRGYGEVGFKLDPNDPGFVQVDNRLFKRLFGDFAPKSGDLVFAKTGELLGIMVNNGYCALLKDFSALRTIRAGEDIRAQKTGGVLGELTARVRALPPKLQ